MTKLRWPMIAAALFLLLFLSNPTIQAKQASSTSRYDQGWLAYDAGHYAEAFEIWQTLAEQGHELAQVNLGAMYDAGQGTAENPTKAIAIGWLFKSGLTHLKNDNLSGARQAYDSIAELAGDHPLAKQLSCKIESKKFNPDADSRIASFAGASFGTGWPISAGYVITNHHVIDAAAEILLLNAAGQQMKARPILSDAVHDIAILQVVDTALLPPALPLATARINVGARVFTMGFPLIDELGVTPKLTDGVISKLSGLQNDPASYQTTVPILPGNSGGPLLNMRGEVVGVVRSMIGVKHLQTGETRVYANASCATKIDRLSQILSKLQPPVESLQTLPHRPENIAALQKRLQNSLLVVVAR